MYITRHIEPVIARIGREFKALLVTGARQVGKSTLLKHLYHDIGYVTFDDPVLLEETRLEPGLFFMNHSTPITLDEVQYIQHLFPYIKMKCDSSNECGQFFMTGSQSFQLMRQVSESLAGRVAILELTGLSLREIKNINFTEPFIPTMEYIKHREKQSVSLDNNLWETIHRGSYPALYESNIDWQVFYSSYVRTYIQRDINDLLKVKNHSQFVRFLSAVAARTGQVLNYTKIADQIDVTVNTVKEWLSLLEASNVIFILQPFSNSSLTRAIKTPKLYFYDTGLVCFLAKYQTPQTAMNGALAGELFETFVMSEIVKSFVNAGIDYRMYLTYYRGKDKTRESEIDLLIEIDDTIYPVEIKLSANPRLDMTNAFDVIDKIKNKRRGMGTVVCMYDKPVYLNENNIALPISYI